MAHVELKVPKDSDDVIAERALRAADDITRANAAAAQHHQQQQDNAAAAAQHAANIETVRKSLDEHKVNRDALSQQWANAMQIGDYAAAARAQNELNDINAEINILQSGIDEMQPDGGPPAQDLRRDGGVVQGTTPQPQRPLTVEDVIQRMPALSEAEKQWLRNHPDSVAPHNADRLQVAYQDSQRRGLTRGSDAYFRFLEGRLDYGPPVEERRPRHQLRPVEEYPGNTGNTDDADDAPASWAPPRQQQTQPRLKPGMIKLTEEQRQMAKASGVDEVTYARGVQRLMEEKSRGLYPSG
jgi:phage-related minor tail protein